MSASTIKAIETNYAGYRFRSRLEARWAVFLNVMGFDWTYEPEGFELPSGRYLPDFRVWFHAGRREGDGFWLEIKGRAPNDQEKTLATDLFWSTRTPVVIADGDIEAYRIGRSDCNCNRCMIAECRHIVWEGTVHALHVWIPQVAQQFLRTLDATDSIMLGPDWEKLSVESGRNSALVLMDNMGINANLDKAVRAARSARFEHGESGAGRKS